MNALHRLFALSVLALGLAPWPASAHDPVSHEHASHDASAQTTTAASAGRWKADATLQRGMQGVRAAVEALEQHEHGHLDPGQVRALAQKIEGHVRDIVAGCKLPPQADAALHGIIAELMRGTAALKSDPSQTQVIAQMRAAIAQYDQLFDEAPADQEQPESNAR